MQGNREVVSEKKDREKGSGFRVRTGLLIACAAVLIVAVVLIFTGQRRAKRESSRLHISSNYLEEGGASYTVADWGSGFDILLYNYEKDNMDQISAADLTYRVTAENGTVSVRDQSGDEAAATADSEYSFGTETGNAYHLLHVMPDAGGDGTVSVTVQTVSPGQKTLTAEFQVQHFRRPDYTVTDQNDGTILITVNTNDYQDDMTVIWEPDKYSPDTANEVMASWTDETPVGNFSVSSNASYELLFYKKTDDLYTEQAGSATEIILD